MTTVLLVLACIVGLLGVAWACCGALLCRYARHAAAPEDAHEFAARCTRCGHWFIANP